MSVLFAITFLEFTLHVCQLRGRPAFIAREIGHAAGYSDDGQPFIDLICREWPASLDDDEHVAAISGAELDMLKRELTLPEESATLLVLFWPGVMVTLLRSRARNARKLIGFLLRNVSTRAEAMIAGCWFDDEDPGQGGAPVAPQPTSPPAAPSPAPSLVDVQATTVSVRLLLADLGHMFDKPLAIAATQGDRELCLLRFEALRDLAFHLRALGLLSNRELGALLTEAVEELLGRPLRSLPPFDTDTDDDRLVA